MRFLYEFAIRLYVLGLHLAALFIPKAKKWVKGRKQWEDRLARQLAPLGRPPLLWMHVSSLGEFEQGRPLLEKFREAYPEWRIVLSFFSPSGYELRKEYPHADVVCYLPADTQANAVSFIQLVRPNLAVFVKYDFWANYLLELKKQQVPTLLVSALFRPSQPFFKWYGGLWRKMLGCFQHLFVQNTDAARLVEPLAPGRVTIAGDTRVDRVLDLIAQAPENPKAAAFSDLSTVLVAGSTWEPDEQILSALLRKPEYAGVKCILAPHEPSDKQVGRILALFEGSVRYSRYDPSVDQDKKVLVIDNVGMLNSLYRFGRWAYIGGGFGKGIHNTLEPAAFGLPLFFGPKYDKFEEARQFVARGGAFPVHDLESMCVAFDQLHSKVAYARASEAVGAYLNESRGATGKVLEWLDGHLKPSASERGFFK